MVKLSSPAAIFGSWLPIRLMELVVFFAAFVASAELLENYRSGDLIYSLKIALMVVITYGVSFLYWPLSFLITTWFRASVKWSIVAGMLFFLAHSVLAISIAYNGVFGISDRISYLSPLVLAWVSVCIVQVAFALLCLLKAR